MVMARLVRFARSEGMSPSLKPADDHDPIARSHEVNQAALARVWGEDSKPTQDEDKEAA